MIEFRYERRFLMKRRLAGHLRPRCPSRSADTEAELRTSISRAYYGLFHVVCQELSHRGVPFHGRGDGDRLVPTCGRERAG